MHSCILPDGDGEVRFFLSDRRAALIALNPVGDVRVDALDRQALKTDTARSLVRSGEHSFKTTRSTAKLIAGLAPLPAPIRTWPCESPRCFPSTCPTTTLDSIDGRQMSEV